MKTKEEQVNDPITKRNQRESRSTRGDYCSWMDERGLLSDLVQSAYYSTHTNSERKTRIQELDIVL